MCLSQIAHPIEICRTGTIDVMIIMRNNFSNILYTVLKIEDDIQ
jgi:hypothetical protein